MILLHFFQVCQCPDTRFQNTQNIVNTKFFSIKFPLNTLFFERLQWFFEDETKYFSLIAIYSFILNSHLHQLHHILTWTQYLFVDIDLHLLDNLLPVAGVLFSNILRLPNSGHYFHQPVVVVDINKLVFVNPLEISHVGFQSSHRFYYYLYIISLGSSMFALVELFQLRTNCIYDLPSFVGLELPQHHSCMPLALIVCSNHRV